MKSEEEIKDFIDSKEALTFTELQKFIRGYNSGKIMRLENKMWDYVLATKDCKILRNYKIKRLTNNAELSFDEFNQIYNKDERFRKYGRKRIKKLLEEQYQKNIGGTLITIYLQRARGRKYEVCT